MKSFLSSLVLILLGISQVCAEQFDVRFSVIESHDSGDMEEVFDIDGDGDLDIITNSAWLENRYDENLPLLEHVFSFDLNITNAYHPIIKAFDIHGDGDGDLIIAKNYYTGVNNTDFYVIENTSEGWNVDTLLVDEYGQISEFNLADFNNDGLIDIQIIHLPDLSGNRVIGLFYQQPGQTLAWNYHELYSGINSNYQFPHSIILDMDNDGDQDIIYFVYNSGNWSVSWLEHNLGWSNHNNFNTTLATYAYQLQGAIKVDFDTDGDYDLICDGGWAENVNPLTNWIWYDEEQFGNIIDYTSNTNVDCDQNIDLLFSEVDTLIWYEKHEQNPVRYRFKDIGYHISPYLIKMVDMDGDGLSEIVYAHYVAKISFAQKALGIDNPWGFNRINIINDDNDPEPEIITHNWGALQYWDFQDGGYTNTITEPVYSGLSVVEIDDINLDENPDLIWSARESLIQQHTLYWSEFNPDFTELTHHVVADTMQENMVAVETGDLNNDGTIDIVAQFEGQWLYFIFQDANGDWSASYYELSGEENGLSYWAGYSYDIKILDFDFDGDNDVFLAGAGARFSWLENLNNSGQYSFHPVQSEHWDQIDWWDEIVCSLVDVDNDNDSDLLMSLNDQSVNLFWLENTGELAGWDFHQIDVFSTSHWFTYHQAIDDDNDGDLDLYLANSPPEQYLPDILRLENFGDGTFSEPRYFNCNQIGYNSSAFVHPQGPVFEFFQPDTSNNPVIYAVGDTVAVYFTPMTHDGSLPPQFELNAPDMGSTCHTLDTLLVWERSFDPDNPERPIAYDVWLDTTASMQTASRIATNVADTSLQVNDLEDDKTYFWNVHAVDGCTEGTWADADYWFETYLVESPGIFSLAYPADGATIGEDTVSVHWHPSVDPDPGDEITYTVEWSIEDDFGTINSIVTTDTFALLTDYSPAFTIASTNETDINSKQRKSNYFSSRSEVSTGTDELPNDQVIFWRVFAVDNWDNQRWANDEDTGWSFTVSDHMPEPFDLIEPENGSIIDSLNVVLSWTETTDPDGITPYYDILIGTVQDLSDAEVLGDSLAGSTFTINTLADDNQYFWTVRATDDNTPGRWANDTLSFSLNVPDPPYTFNLVAPDSGFEFIDSREFPIVFRWENNSDPDPDDEINYTFVLATDPDFSDSISYDAETADSIAIDELEASSYWWHVIASDNTELITVSNQSWLINITLNVDEKGLFSEIPEEYSIAGTYPNPFNSIMTIVVGLPEPSVLKLSVYNLLGQQVALITNQTTNRGFQRFTFNANDLSSGIYFVHAEVEGKLSSFIKIVLTK